MNPDRHLPTTKSLQFHLSFWFANSLGPSHLGLDDDELVPSPLVLAVLGRYPKNQSQSDII